MDFNNKNMFGNQAFKEQIRFQKNPVLTNTVANLKAMSTDASKRNQVLSTLARFQGQMNPADYNEILANVKSVEHSRILDGNKPELDSKREISEQDYQATVSSLRNLEYEMRRK